MSRLDELERRYCERPGSMPNHERAELMLLRGDELKRLREIVATLPKCWRLDDGKLVQDCPVVLGMELWVPGTGVWDDKLWKIKVTTIDSEGFISTNIGGRPQHWHSRVCANSREAAEALAEDDLSPCMGCGHPVYGVPEGLTLCEKCAKRKEPE